MKTNSDPVHEIGVTPTEQQTYSVQPEVTDPAAW